LKKEERKEESWWKERKKERKSGRLLQAIGQSNWLRKLVD
jgi:hypothetical protein